MRYVVTGGSGYIGSRMIERLVESDDTERIVIADVRPPKGSSSKIEFVECDVSGPKIHSLLRDEKADCLIHLAFILNPIHDLDKMYAVDVNGCQNVLSAAANAGVKHVLVTSSTTAYGAWPDNPVPIPEEQLVRGVPQFEYSRDKAESDRICQLWALQNPKATMTIVRPSMVMGPNVDNFISRSWKNFPFMPLLDGADPPIQFVHEDDLAEAMIGLLLGKKKGIFNITGDGTMTWSEGATAIGLKSRSISFKTMYRIAGALWKLHAPKTESPAGMLYFLRYPWVASNEKVKKELKWEPKYTTREIFDITAKAKGIGKDVPQRAAKTAVS